MQGIRAKRASFEPHERRILIAWAFAAAVLLCIAVPRVGPLVVVSMTTVLSIYLLAQDTRRDGASAIERVILSPELLFALWAVIASLWSPDVLRGFGKSLFLVALILHAIILVRKFHLIDSRDIEAAARGLVVGFLLGGLYVCFEIHSRDNLTRFVLTQFPELDRAVPKHAQIRDGVIVRMSGAHITRVTAVFCLFICPALLAATLYTKGWIKWFCYGMAALFLGVIFVHPHTHSQTGQLIAVVVPAVIALALIAPQLARWAVAAGFVAWLLLVVPGSLAMYSWGVHENNDLFTSARARVLIWHNTAEEILKHPIVGGGTTSSRFFEEAPETKKKISEEKLGGGLDKRGHPHNMYLQIWYELGVIGALLFGLLVYRLWTPIGRLPKRIAVLVTAHFAVCTTIIGPTYSMWQNWFQSAFALSILSLMAIAFVAAKSSGPGPPDAE